jgi:hypothetical protein
MVNFCCPTCQAALTAPDEAVGQTIACPGCQRPIQVAPAPPAAFPPPNRVPAPPLRCNVERGLLVPFAWGIALAWACLALLLAFAKGAGAESPSPAAPLWACANILFAFVVATAVERLARG